MKRFLLFFLCALLACPLSWGTGQESDVLISGGEEWALLDLPLERLDSLTYCQLRDTFGWESPSTANWRGYVAYWSVSDGMLWLEKVVRFEEELVKVGEEKEAGTDLLISETVAVECDYGIICRVLERYVRDGKVCASWFSGEMTAGKGRIVRYVHMGLNRDYEEEIVISVTRGAASLGQVYHNRAGLGPQDNPRLLTYLKAFPTDGYGLEKGRYVFRFKYDTESGKWVARLYQPPVLEKLDALDNAFTDYLNAYDGELRDYIRGEWTSSRVFTFPFVVE